MLRLFMAFYGYLLAVWRLFMGCLDASGAPQPPVRDYSFDHRVRVVAPGLLLVLKLSTVR